MIGLEGRLRDKPRMRWMVAALVLALLAGCGDSPPPETAMPPDELAIAEPPEPNVEAPVADAPAEASAESSQDLLPLEPEAEAGWEPGETMTEGESTDDVLARADAAFEAGRLTDGADSALGLYLAVIAAEPGQTQAVAGVDRIIETLVLQLESALASADLGSSRKLIPILRKLRPEDPRLPAWQADFEHAREVVRLLRKAQQEVAADRLLEPPETSAVRLYRDILERDPEQPEALAGLARIEAELVAQATAAAEAGDYARSDKLLADATRVQPGSGGVQDAGSQIVELRQGRAADLLQRAQVAAARGDVSAAEHLLEQLEQVSVQSQGIEELRQQIEQARLYAGFAPGQTLTDRLRSGATAPDLVVIAVGEFRMGSRRDEAQRRKEEGPSHEVRVARGFALGASEVTVTQFRAFVQASGHVGSATRRGRSSAYDERSGNLRERSGIDWQHDYAGADAAPNLPVVHVSWSDAQAYVDWLARETGESYRLPSEAEFEYALRAGSVSRYPWGDGTPDQLLENLTGEKDRSSRGRAWNHGFRNYGDGHWGPAPVRSFAANRLGLHDSNGNVSEWVADCWHDNYSRAPTDASAWVNPGCTKRVIRGASWASAPDEARSAYRSGATPGTTHARLGFRVARDL